MQIPPGARQPARPNPSLWHMSQAGELPPRCPGLQSKAMETQRGSQAPESGCPASPRAAGPGPAQPPAPCVQASVQCLKKPGDAVLTPQPLPGSRAHSHVHFCRAGHAAQPGSGTEHRGTGGAAPAHLGSPNTGEQPTAVRPNTRQWEHAMAASAASSLIACSILAGVLSALPSRSRPLSRHSGCHHRSLQAVPHPVSTAMLPNTRGRPQQSITQTEPGTRKLLMGGRRRHVSVLPNPLVLVCTSALAISRTVQHLLRGPLTGPFFPSHRVSVPSAPLMLPHEAQLSPPLPGHHQGKKDIEHTHSAPRGLASKETWIPTAVPPS